MVNPLQPSADTFQFGGGLLLRCALLAFALLAMTACAINPRIDLEELAPDSGPLLLQSVPFFPQTEYQCGPAALASVLNESGIVITPEQLAAQVYLPERKGSLQVELLAATRRAGRIAYVVDPEALSLMRELEAGRPVLVLQNLGTRGIPIWHYAVLVGVDPAANDVVLNSGKREHMDKNARSFFRTWDWAERWGMVALKPGTLPESPDALRYYQAVAAFESVADEDAALEAWTSAMARWPGDYRPLFAMGNLAHKSGNYQAAILHFRRALELSPGEPAIENNLAEALAASGCPRTAERHLASILAGLDESSPWRQDLVTTLNQLQSNSGEDSANCKSF